MKLIRLLKQAHAIEIGAYEAYEGHIKTLFPSRVSYGIMIIQSQEADHRYALKCMLESLEAKPSWFMDTILWCIGRSISLACYVMGYRAAMWGAKIMEIMGSKVYYELAREAAEQCFYGMSDDLFDMALQEEHEEFFIKYAKP